ncbi:MFS transporter [Paenibacillus sp. FA6]|uniref:MFS transporter n=1 Tax=Paenibacillus sp. FA6 TaxID=3413029 RepID=UPI003F65B179
MRTQRKKIFNKNYSLQLATIFIGFIIFGISENIKGPAIPRIQMSFNIDEIQLGTLLSLNALGYLIACSFTALLTRKIGIKWASMIAFGSMIISGILIFVSHTYAFFSASYFLMYIGNGMLEIALAILGARIFVKNTGMMMNLSHFFYGLSSTVAPLIASGLMTLTIFNHTLDWRGMYLVMLCLSVIPMIPTLMSRFPGDDLLEEDRIPLKVLMRDPALWLLVAILSFGVVSELAVGGWLVNFLEKSYDWNTTAAAGMLSTFFLFFAGARLFLGPVTDKIGFNLSIIILSGFAGICTFIAILAGEPAAIFFALAGIGIAPIYPTVMAFIAKRYPTGSDTAITFTVTMMGVGSVIGNYLIGAIINVVKDAYGVNTEIGLLRGLQAGYGFIGLCALICSVAGIILYKYLKKRNELI